MALVKCLICGQLLDKETESYVQLKRRYAHKNCYDNLPQIQKDNIMYKDKIHSKAKELFKEHYNYAVISKQIDLNLKKISHGTIKGIYLSMVYWFEVKKEPIEKSFYRLGIVPYIYDEAQNYFKRQEKNKKINENKNIEEYLNIEKEQITIHPQPIEKPRKIKLFNLDG